MSHTCNICKKHYSSYQSLWIHNKKFHANTTDKNNPVIVANNPNLNIMNDKSICKYCNKKFSCPQNRWKHENKVCKKNYNKDYGKIIRELQNEIKELKKNKENNNTITNNTTTNNNNGTINSTTNNNNNGTINNIVINNFGNESVHKLTTNDIKILANENINAFIKIVEMLNFDKKYPENHIFCNTSLDGNYLSVLDTDTNQIEKILKKDFFDKVLLNSIKKINEVLVRFEIPGDNLQNINKKYLLKLEDISMKGNEILNNQKQKITYKRNINQLSYNKKNLVLDTWNKLNLNEKDDVNDDDESIDNNTIIYSDSDESIYNDNSSDYLEL